MNICKKNFPGLTSYLKYWKMIIEKDNRGDTDLIGFNEFWSDGYNDAHYWRKHFLQGVNNRIMTRGEDWRPRGKKDNDTYFTDMMRDKHALQDKVNRRIRVYQFNTPEVKRRFVHLLSDRREDW
jgi:hypothetical protein